MRITAIRRAYTNGADVSHARNCIAPATSERALMRRCSSQPLWIPTPFASAVDKMVTFALTENAGDGDPDAQRVVAIDAEPNSGKTRATERAMLIRTADAWDLLGMNVSEDIPRIPWAYVRLGATSGSRNAVEAVARAFGRNKSTGTIDEITQWIVQIAEQSETQGLVIDEVHEVRGASAAEITHIIRNLMAVLPLTIVLIGAGLETSAVLNGLSKHGSTASDQIDDRALWVRGKKYALAADSVQWQGLLRTLAGQVHMPDGQEAAEVFLDSDLCKVVHAGVRGRIGRATLEIRMAAFEVAHNSKADFREELIRRLRERGSRAADADA